MKKNMKACSKCKVKKPVSGFSLKNTGSEVRRSICKSCQLARDNKWRARNRDKVNAASRKWNKENPEARRAFQNKYRERHPERVIAMRAKWVVNNRMDISIRRAAARDAIRLRIIEHYAPGKKCVRCGHDDIQVLCIDHINDDGHLHRRAGLTGTAFYAWLIKNKFPSGFQILCANCNTKKAWIYARASIGKEKSGKR